MKKLSVVLLVSCLFVGTVSAMDGGRAQGDKSPALQLLKEGATRILPAAGGYVTAGLAKGCAGSYGFMALLGLSLAPVALDYNKNPHYAAKTSSSTRTALNSFAAGVALRGVQDYVPASVSNKFKSKPAALTELRGAGRYGR